MRALHAWVFDLDGTLTVAMHDFADMRRSLGIAPSVNLLEGMLALPPERRREAEAAVEAWEWEHAERAQPAPGAEALLTALSGAGVRLGILTRNLRPIALRTLQVTGLASFFHDDDVLGRTDAHPKPAPDGVLHLLTRWSMRPEQGVMVGDYVHDAQAGRAAGVRTVLVGDRLPDAWSPFVDHGPTTLPDLLQQWRQQP